MLLLLLLLFLLLLLALSMSGYNNKNNFAHDTWCVQALTLTIALTLLPLLLQQLVLCCYCLLSYILLFGHLPLFLHTLSYFSSPASYQEFSHDVIVNHVTAWERDGKRHASKRRVKYITLRHEGICVYVFVVYMCAYICKSPSHVVDLKSTGKKCCACRDN